MQHPRASPAERRAISSVARGRAPCHIVAKNLEQITWKANEGFYPSANSGYIGDGCCAAAARGAAMRRRNRERGILASGEDEAGGRVTIRRKTWTDGFAEGRDSVDGRVTFRRPGSGQFGTSPGKGAPVRHANGMPCRAVARPGLPAGQGLTDGAAGAAPKGTGNFEGIGSVNPALLGFYVPDLQGRRDGRARTTFPRPRPRAHNGAGDARMRDLPCRGSARRSRMRRDERIWTGPRFPARAEDEGEQRANRTQVMRK